MSEDLYLDMKVNNLTGNLNQLLEYGFAVGIDTEENRFIVVCKHTADPTHYINYDEDEECFYWSNSE